MTFTATLVNRISIPAPFIRSSLIIRGALVTGGLAGALTAGAIAFPGTALAQEPPNHTTLVTSASQPFPTWCPFGTRGGKKGHCRGGSIGDDIREHGYSYATNVGCGVAGVAAGAVTANPAIGLGAGVGCGVLLQDDPAN